MTRRRLQDRHRRQIKKTPYFFPVRKNREFFIIKYMMHTEYEISLDEKGKCMIK